MCGNFEPQAPRGGAPRLRTSTTRNTVVASTDAAPRDDKVSTLVNAPAQTPDTAH